MCNSAPLHKPKSCYVSGQKKKKAASLSLWWLSSWASIIHEALIPYVMSNFFSLLFPAVAGTHPWPVRGRDRERPGQSHWPRAGTGLTGPAGMVPMQSRDEERVTRVSLTWKGRGYEFTCVCEFELKDGESDGWTDGDRTTAAMAPAGHRWPTVTPRCSSDDNDERLSPELFCFFSSCLSPPAPTHHFDPACPRLGLGQK